MKKENEVVWNGLSERKKKREREKGKAAEEVVWW